jgi:hypothetical protein
MKLTEADWANYEHYNKPGQVSWVEYNRTDPQRTKRLQRAMDLKRAEPKRETFARNLSDANGLAAEGGLPEMTLEDALVYYGHGGHNYQPSAPDKGGNEAGAWGHMNLVRWSICVCLHEGLDALENAGNAQNAAFAEFAKVLPQIHEATGRINALVRQD